MPAIETVNLKKSYSISKKQPGVKGVMKAIFKPEKSMVEAVKGISLSLEKGEVVGFLGPNGAGKTTTLKMLSGILYPTSGTCSVLGYRPTDRNPEMLRKISLVMGNKQQLWWDLPAWDSFVVFRELYEIEKSVFDKRVKRLIDELDLGDKVNTQVRRLSLGERMKCELVASLLYSPEVVFLDEPTLGLDVVSQKRIREFLSEQHREEGCTILLTSHYMQDVQKLCERVVIIDHGVVKFDNTLEALSQQHSDTRRIQLQFSETVPPDDLAKFGRIIESDAGSATLEALRADIPSITASVLANLPVIDVSISEPDIEDVIREMFSKEQQVVGKASS